MAASKEKLPRWAFWTFLVVYGIAPAAAIAYAILIYTR